MKLRKTASLLIAACMLTASTAGASAYTDGDWVLGNYRGAGYWFPGVVSSTSGDRIVVQYDDGDIETLSPGEVRPYDWAIGSRVECNYQGAGDWYAGKISSLAGERIGIAYDDGDKETTTTGMCRSR